MRSSGSVFVVSPGFPRSYPPPPNPAHPAPPSSCAMEVLIPAGQRTFAHALRSQLPANTALGVCGNSLQIAMPRAVIDTTYCSELGEGSAAPFSSDFLVRYFGAWRDEAQGTLLQISGEFKALLKGVFTLVTASTFFDVDGNFS